MADHNPYYEPTKFKANEKDIENYQTGKKETIAYKNILSPGLFNAELGNKARSGKVWWKTNSNGTLAPKLEVGEFAVVERQYAEVGMFEFTTRNHHTIKNAADVAFIFRQLENEAVEHGFAVYIDKNKNPFIQWLSMGGINAAIIDPRIMIDAAQRLQAKEIYLVHNHPSGNLVASKADINIVGKLKRGFEPMGIGVHAIIINLNSGKYLLFDEEGSSLEREGFNQDDFISEEKAKIFSFNKQAFLQSPTDKSISSPSDAAEFLSQQRFSSGKKTGYLLLTTSNEIVGNFFATQNTPDKAYQEVAGLVSRFGGINVVAYTNKADTSFYKELKSRLKNLDISLHDVIECESSPFVIQTFDKYKSLVQEGLLYESPTNYETHKTKIMETQNTLREETLADQSDNLKHNEQNYLQRNLDYICNQIKYLGFGEGFNEALKEAIQSGNEKIDFPISKEFSSSPEESNSIDFTLHLNKGKESNMYFLNSYSAQLNTPDIDPKNVRSQTFYLNKGKGFTAKEVFNLLSDRSVNKDLTNREGESYNAWVKLKPEENSEEKGNRTFQVFSENYGYDLKESLSKFPIKEMGTPEAEARLMNSLKKGNLQSVTFSGIDGDDKKYIEAVPQYKNINVYNEEGKKQFIPQSLSEQGERIFSPAAPAHDISMKDLTPADELAIKTEAQNALAQGKGFAVIDTSFNRSKTPAERIQYFSNEQRARETALLKGNNLVDTKSLILSANHTQLKLSPKDATEILNRAKQYAADGFKYTVVDTSKLVIKEATEGIKFYPSLIQAAKAATGKEAFIIKTDELALLVKNNQELSAGKGAVLTQKIQLEKEPIKTANELNQKEDLNMQGRTKTSEKVTSSFLKR